MGNWSLFRKNYTTISPQLAQQMVLDGAVLLDVRTAAEYSRGHSPAARNVPLEHVGRRSRDLPADTPVIAICHSGARSAIAARTLARHGLAAYSVRGGTTAWNNAGNPTTLGGEQ